MFEKKIGLLVKTV